MNVAAKVGGHYRFVAGLPSGMVTVKGKLATEIEAFQTLAGTNAIPIQLAE
jgi:hypothetical protein